MCLVMVIMIVIVIVIVIMIVIVVVIVVMIVVILGIIKINHNSLNRIQFLHFFLQQASSIKDFICRMKMII